MSYGGGRRRFTNPWPPYFIDLVSEKIHDKGFVIEPESNKDKDENLKYLKVVLEATSIPFVLLGGPMVGFFIGSFLDQKLGSGKVFLLLFVVLGFVAAVKETIFIIKRVQKVA